MFRITSRLSEIAKSEAFKEALEKIIKSEKAYDTFMHEQTKNKKLKR